MDIQFWRNCLDQMQTAISSDIFDVEKDLLARQLNIIKHLFKRTIIQAQDLELLNKVYQLLNFLPFTRCAGSTLRLKGNKSTMFSISRQYVPLFQVLCLRRNIRTFFSECTECNNEYQFHWIVLIFSAHKILHL